MPIMSLPATQQQQQQQLQQQQQRYCHLHLEYSTPTPTQNAHCESQEPVYVQYKLSRGSEEGAMYGPASETIPTVMNMASSAF